MNKDLAENSAVWRALHGVRGRRFCCLFVYLCRLVVKEQPKMVLRRMMGPSLETGAVLDVALSKNSRRIAIGCLCCRYEKNVMKKAGVEFGLHRSVKPW
jgi:hypothetical protein